MGKLRPAQFGDFVLLYKSLCTLMLKSFWIIVKKKSNKCPFYETRHAVKYDYRPTCNGFGDFIVFNYAHAMRCPIWCKFLYCVSTGGWNCVLRSWLSSCYTMFNGVYIPSFISSKQVGKPQLGNGVLCASILYQLLTFIKTVTFYMAEKCMLWAWFRVMLTNY